jgi:hypothetical protein
MPSAAPGMAESLASAAGGAPEAGGGGGALTGGGVGMAAPGGYLDSAIPQTLFRMRFTAATDDEFPDRAEYIYPKCGCFKTPDAKGPPLPETRIDYQELTGYLEWAPWERFSAFIEVPWKFINPEQNSDNSGFGDLQVGFKWAFLYEPGQVMSLQVRNYIPTGEPQSGLGTAHYSIEPSLLYYGKWSDRLEVQGQFDVWVPIGGSDFAGNILEYGFGAAYCVWGNDRIRVKPVAEMLGWTVLSGEQSVFSGGAVEIESARTTIVNAKGGVRIEFGSQPNRAAGFLGNSDLYVGYGTRLTGQWWYREILRVEYRIRF